MRCPTGSPLSHDTHASNNQHELATQEFMTYHGFSQTGYQIITSCFMQIYKLILQVLPTLCLSIQRWTSYGVTRLTSDMPLSHGLLTLTIDISKNLILWFMNNIFSCLLLCTTQHTVGFPRGQDSATFWDKGTKVPSSSRYKGTTGQAKNLAKGRDGPGQPKPGTGRAGTAKIRDGTRDKTGQSRKGCSKTV